jgi:hypothetical protein
MSGMKRNHREERPWKGVVSVLKECVMWLSCVQGLWRLGCPHTSVTAWSAAALTWKGVDLGEWHSPGSLLSGLSPAAWAASFFLYHSVP